ncbi:hypothetical protein LOD99_12318 [Oopsacas minuta]|uniref:Uncharacterized protein n=1 Tax=Oopsacas minuta TaxID=111878 RepID=A0AAV7JFZ6_9METZ|nr:hypothetical protein LOD99_12318 [Oopsacas minuta]
MQQKTLQNLVLTSVKHKSTIPTRKKSKLTPPLKPTQSQDVQPEKDEYMTQLIDTILNDQSLLDKLVNYINQSLDTPNDTDTNTQDQMRPSDIAENVIRLTESDPEFGGLLWHDNSNS